MDLQIAVFNLKSSFPDFLRTFIGSSKKVLRHFSKSNAVYEIRFYFTIPVHDHDIADGKGMPSEILRTINIESLINRIQSILFRKRGNIFQTIIFMINEHFLFIHKVMAQENILSAFSFRINLVDTKLILRHVKKLCFLQRRDLFMEIIFITKLYISCHLFPWHTKPCIIRHLQNLISGNFFKDTPTDR